MTTYTDRCTDPDCEISMFPHAKGSRCSSADCCEAAASPSSAEVARLREERDAVRVALGVVEVHRDAVLRERDAARAALREIRDYEPEREAFRLDNESCPDCKRNRERQWPPSGLCEKHYGQAADNRDRRERTEARQHYRMREIARAALASLGSPQGSPQDERNTKKEDA
jgi:hypothetical protein